MSTVNEHLQGRLILPDTSSNTGKLGKASSGHTLSGQPTAADVLVGRDGFGFGDVLDAVNPLNHIPIVSQLVGASGETPVSAVSKIAGGALFGGPIGAGIAAVSALFEMATGDSPVGTVVSALAGEAETPSTGTATLLSADKPYVEPEKSTAQQIADAAIEAHIPIPQTEEEEKAKAASGAFRLGIDTVAEQGKSEKAVEELANAVKPQVGMSLRPDVSDVAMRALGANSLEHQIYRQVQTVDPLYSRALDMRG